MTIAAELQKLNLEEAGFIARILPTGKIRVSCDQCQAAVINGMACHETGCPNQERTKSLEFEE